MKLCTILRNGEERLGVLVGDHILDVAASGISGAPSDMLAYLRGGEAARTLVEQAVAWFTTADDTARAICSVAASVAQIFAPVPHPTSMRDGYAFRQHVEAARRNRGVEMIPEFDEIPIFY
ncbi:MAG: fumarylacetoacetate hydrolase family protein, partial [Candidatus Kapaibacterium sp.]